MNNFERLRDAGLLPDGIRQADQLDTTAYDTIDSLTSEEVDALISAFDKIRGDEAKNRVRETMSICGF